MKSSEHPVLDLLLLLLGRKKVLYSIVLVSMVLTAAYSLVMPKTFTSYALVVPPAGSDTGLASIIGSLPMGDMLGGMVGVNAGGDGGYFLAVLQSRVMMERVLDEFDLREHYKMPDEKIEIVLKKMRRMIRASLDFETGFISLNVLDRDPQYAYEMCSYLLSELEKLNREYKVRKAASTRRFVQGEVGKIRARLDSLETALVQFQQTQRVLEPTEQARVILSEYAEIKTQAELKELELRMARMDYAANHPEIKRLEAELLALRTKLQDSYENGDSDLFLAISDLPATAIDYLRYQRELEIENQKLIFMLPQLEQAKIEEVNDTEVLQVLDPPRVAEKKTKPKRAIMVLAAGFLSLIVGSLIVVLLDRIEQNQEFRRRWDLLMKHILDSIRFRWS